MAAVKGNGAEALPLEKYSPGVAFAGAGSCTATLMSILVFSHVQLDEPFFFLDKALSVLCIVAVFLVYHLFSDALSSLRGERGASIVAATGMAAFAIGSLAPVQSAPFTIVCDCLGAVGASALLVVWFVDLCLRPRNLPVAHVAGAFGIAAVVMLGEYFFDPEVRAVVQVAVWALSCVLAFTLYRHHKRLEIPSADFDNEVAEARSRITLESNVMMAVIYCQLGILLGMSYVDAGQAVPAVLLAAGIACLLMVVDSAAHKPIISERSLFLATVPATTAALACIYLFGGGAAHMVALCLLAIIDVLYLTLGAVALSSHILYERLPPVRTFGKFRAVHYLSVLAGMAIGVAAGRAYAENPLWGIQFTVLAAIAYCFASSFFHRVRMPDTTLRFDGSQSAAPVKGIDKIIERCSVLRERRGLSARQYEVLCLIAQGRNAEYVANNLTISLSTVQTHIRNIYQKLDVHSRQELLDLIENTKLYGED